MSNIGEQRLVDMKEVFRSLEQARKSIALATLALMTNDQKGALDAIEYAQNHLRAVHGDVSRIGEKGPR